MFLSIKRFFGFGFDSCRLFTNTSNLTYLKGKDMRRSSMVMLPLSKEARIPPEFTMERCTASSASLQVRGEERKEEVKGGD